tara:strand:- start:877 stop:1383 length:507 start_codon:yes stop_codon:yes gene_type:complete
MKTLKLDSSYRPISIIDARKALIMYFMGKAEIVEYSERTIKTVDSTYKLPSVIALKRYVKYYPFSLICNRKNVIWRDRSTCQYCGKHFPEAQLTLDHVTPKSRNGPKSWDNLVAACRKCNQKKGNRTPQESKMFPISKPRKPPSMFFKTIAKGQVLKNWLPYLWGSDE